MINTIKSEWRKNRFRPALLIGSGLTAAVTALAYSANWYVATHPGNADHPVNISALYPDHFVNAVLGAGFPLGAALAIVLGAIIAGSEYSWSTVKTTLTQRPGRLTLWAGRVIVFSVWMGIMTAILFVIGAVYSVAIASVEGAAITWPAADLLLKGVGAIYLILVVNGAIGLALGTLIRQSAAALGIGLVYLLAVEVIAVRFIDGLNNGAYKWIGDLFVGQNGNALLGSISPGPVAPSISAEQAVIVLFAWFVGLMVVAAGLLRLRDVS
jgi:ABC-type transport system involved in multi-copper enzyme maturation permease subunit